MINREGMYTFNVQEQSISKWRVFFMTGSESEDLQEGASLITD